MCNTRKVEKEGSDQTRIDRNRHGNTMLKKTISTNERNDSPFGTTRERVFLCGICRDCEFESLLVPDELVEIGLEPPGTEYVRSEQFCRLGVLGRWEKTKKTSHSRPCFSSAHV